MSRLFGTDGIRGVANQYPMTPAMAVKVGQAIGLYFNTSDGNRNIVIGRDTRLSGDMLASSVSAGICSTGVNVLDGGILPTPAIAHLAREKAALAGVVISASHNPFEDNGIKIFKGSGFKLSDKEEAEIEGLVNNSNLEAKVAGVQDMGILTRIELPGSKYVDFLAGSLSDGLQLKGLNLVLDCSNGATYQVGPELFSRRLGANVTVLSADPDGKNINTDCGSQHPEHLSRVVVEIGADLGLAFDGDGDRLIAVDEKGAVLAGDQVLAVLASYLKTKDHVGNGTVVSTVMSNLGLKEALTNLGLTHVSCQVGDRYVMEKMLQTGAVLGGEDSGHMILMDHHTTGDGMLSGLKLIEAVVSRQKPLSELAGIMNVYPQSLLNVGVSSKPDLTTLGRVSHAIQEAENRLGNNGRVLVRYSGTQQICRIMVEGPTTSETDTLCRMIAAAVKEEIGL